MNHDMAHCDGAAQGQACLLRDGCRRFLAHKEYQADAGLKAQLSVPYMQAEECFNEGNRRYRDATDEEEGW